MVNMILYGLAQYFKNTYGSSFFGSLDQFTFPGSIFSMLDEKEGEVAIGIVYEYSVGRGWLLVK